VQAGPVVRKRVAPAAPPAAAPAPLLDELLLPPGRNVLERLVRRHGGRRVALVGALEAGYVRADGRPIDGGDLDRLFEHHGLLRAFQRRERDELLHAVRAAGGVLGAAAARLGLDRDGLASATRRLGAEAEVEALRDARRRVLLARITLSERARLVVAEAAALADLDLLQVFETDLRSRLPEHLRALGASPGSIRLALARTLSLDVAAVVALAARLGVALEDPPRAEAHRPPLPPRTTRATRRPARRTPH
jgi:hypothetical protein